MSRTLQQLRTDVNSLQSTLKELHSLLKISPDAIKVPSWRYPEKMATSVRVQVKECEDHQLLLELLVDRLVLVLQSCVLEMERVNSPGTSGVPLSLSSTIRKFTQGFSQQTVRSKELNETVDKLKKELLLLQNTTTNYRDIIINQLGPTALPNNIPNDTTTTSKLVLTGCNSKTVSTQTLQTSMATDIRPKTCLQCPKHLEDQALMSKAINTLQRELTQHFTPVSSSSANVVSKENEGALESDLALIKECFTSCEEQRVSLKEELLSKNSHITQLEEQYSQVMKNVTELQDEIKNNQKKYEDDICSFQATSKVTLNELKSELTHVRGVANTLQKEIISLRKTEVQLEATLAQKKEEILTLQTSFKSSLKEKELLQKAKKELNEFIMLLKKDYNVVSQELHQKSLELNKTSTQLFNMENRCKYLQSKQMKLLTQVDEMDQNCTHLNQLLNAAINERDTANEKLTEMTDKCSKTLDELQKEKLLLEESNKSNDTIRQECHQLQQVIKVTQEQLKEQRDKTHLLMEYPFHATINRSADSRQSREHIDANCARILLLEEQNLELRRIITPHANPHCVPPPILEPMKLWESIPKSANVNHHTVNSTSSSMERLGSASSFNSD